MKRKQPRLPIALAAAAPFTFALLATAAPPPPPPAAPSVEAAPDKSGELGKPALKIDETTLYRIPSGVKVADTIVSPDSRHVACVETRTEGAERTYDVCIDAAPGPRVRWVVGRSLLFSPDGSRFTYQTQQDGPISVVIDSVSRVLGGTGSTGTGAGSGTDTSATSTGAADPAGAGAETKPAAKGYWMAGHVTFSPDGRRTAFAAQTEKGRYVLVCDGAEAGPYDGIDDSQVLFSPVGNHLAYRAKRAAAAGDDGAAPAGPAGEKQYFVLDGKPGPAFDGASEPVFSTDGSRFGYHAKQGKYEFYVVDGKLGPGYDMVGGLTFSPDGRRCAYAGGQAGRQMLVVDGKAYKPFDGLGEIAFSPDGHRVAVSTQTGPKWSVVVDGVPSAGYDGVAALRFSPDSRRLAFVAGASWRQLIVADGKEGPPFDGVTAVTFSPDSRRLAYLALDRLGKAVMADARRVGAGEAFAFSPDGRHLARTLLYPDGHWGLAVDGTEAEARYDGFPLGSQIVFDSSDTFRIIGGRGNELLRVDVHIR